MLLALICWWPFWYLSKALSLTIDQTISKVVLLTLTIQDYKYNFLELINKKTPKSIKQLKKKTKKLVLLIDFLITILILSNHCLDLNLSF